MTDIAYTGLYCWTRGYGGSTVYIGYRWVTGADAMEKAYELKACLSYGIHPSGIPSLRASPAARGSARRGDSHVQSEPIREGIPQRLAVKLHYEDIVFDAREVQRSDFIGLVFAEVRVIDHPRR